MNTVGRVAWTASVSTGLMIGAGVWLVVLDPAATSLVFLVVGAVIALGWAVLGPIVARVAPGNFVAALAALVGFNVAFTVTRELGWQFLAVRPALLSDMTWLALGLREAFVWVLVSLGLLLLYFPDGRPPSRRWRMVPPTMIVAAAISHAWGLVDPVPFRPPLEGLIRPPARPPVWAEVISVVAFFGLIALLVACAVSMIVRFRAGKARIRAQIRWMALAGVGVPGFLVVCGTEILLTGSAGPVSVAIGLAAVTGLPIATGIAMARHDLFDVDRMLSSAVTYACLSAVLVAVFATAVLTSGLLLGGESTAAAVMATTVTAMALAPVRSRLQRAVDRRLYPRRRAVVEALIDFQRRIHAGEAQPEALQDELRIALHDPGLRVGYLVPAAAGLVDAHGEEVDTSNTVPVLFRGEPIGALAPGEGSSSAELMRVVADACAVLVEVVRLRLEVTEALHEVEASRTRLVHAEDAERRRLERDLHDGSQQRLVSLGMALRVAQRQLPTGTVDVSGLLDQAVAEIGTAVAELRQIAHGLRPGNLDDGLRAALQTLVSTVPIPVALDIVDEQLPDDLTTTLYYVASEAITNAVKHAAASRIDVSIHRSNGQVELRVVDDGRGGAVPVSGAGLTGLEDRVAAAGGVFLLESRPGGGTVLAAKVPCES
jgi:signal transduction histidine kinase